MDVKQALKNQYHAAFGMLRQAIERCPDEMWAKNDHPRDFWRIAYHAVFYTHLYLQNTFTDFVRWELDRDDNTNLHVKPWAAGKGPKAYAKAELLSYLQTCDGSVDGAVDAMDLEAETCGFTWYQMPKFEHQLLNLRHINQHVGQLSELLMGAGIDTDWMGRAR